jgi:hypothetical protein
MIEPAITPLIVTIRGQRVMLSSDLARVYGVETKVLNQAIARHRGRFPRDFAFRLNHREAAAIQCSRSQFVTLKRGHNIKHLPLALTEHGAIMAASILNSPRAVQMSVFVVRAFLRLRGWVASQAELSARLAQLERRVCRHDHDIGEVIRAVRGLLVPPAVLPRRRIGFGHARS